MNQLLRFLEYAALWVDRVCRAVCCLLVVGIVGATFAQIICRKVFSSPLSWAEEFTRLLFVWLSCLGSVLAIRLKNQIQFDFLVSSLLSARMQNLVRILIDLFIAAFFIFLTPPTLALVRSMNSIPSAALSWPSGLSHLGYLTGCLFMVVAFLGDCAQAVRELLALGGAGQ